MMPLEQMEHENNPQMASPSSRLRLHALASSPARLFVIHLFR
jgi:hypothetical protein